MDFVSGLVKKAQSNPPSETQPNNPDQPSNADLLSSAKVVAGAAQSQFHNEDYDKAKAAGATADLLDAAKEYGKLDDSQGLGKYVDQAEGYLRQYDSYAQPGAAAGEPKIPKADDPAPAVDSGNLKSPTGDKIEISGGEEPSGGVGKYVKKAEDLLEKPSGGGEEGGHLKEAEEVVKKPVYGGSGEKDKAEEAPSEGGDGGFGSVMKAAGGILNK